MPDPGPFPQDALEANRAGRLTPDQRSWLRGLAKSNRSNMRVLAVAAAALGLILLVFGSNGGAFRVLGGVALLILGGFLFLRALTGADPLDADLRAGHVESIEGAIAKNTFTTHGRSSSSTTYYIDVEGKHMVAFRDQYQAAPEAGYVRVYYAPRSMRVVNLERLPDKPLAPGALDSPQQAVKAALGSMLTVDPIKRAEAGAELASIGDAIQPKLPTTVMPPPEGARDPRPLAQAILGTWSSGIVTVTFNADGTAVATVMGRDRRGSWSVDGNGRVVSDVTGHSGAAEAWIVGDELTISQGGTGMTFSRA